VRSVAPGAYVSCKVPPLALRNSQLLDDARCLYMSGTQPPKLQLNQDQFASWLVALDDTIDLRSRPGGTLTFLCDVWQV
jgi:hypothetical protein